MGQLLERDIRPQLPIKIHEDNVKPVTNKECFVVCPYLEFDQCKRIFFIENQQEIEALYRFGTKHTIHLQLKKEKSKKSKGIYIKMGDQYVYAYKHRKLDRSDQIKPQKLLFKKRIYADGIKKQEEGQQKIQKVQSQLIESSEFKQVIQNLMRKFAEIKLLSLFEIGPKIGRVYNGSDGIITNQYIQFFSQITIDKIQNCIPKNSQLKQLQTKLLHLNIPHHGIVIKNQNLSYSRWKRSYVLKQNHYYQKGFRPIAMSHQNQSIHYIIRVFQTQITQAIMDLDNEAKMLPFINNLIFQHDFQKAISKFQEHLPMIQNQEQKIEYAQEISSMISKHTSGSKQYQRRIQKIISASSSRQSRQLDNSYLNSATTSRNQSVSISLKSINIVQNNFSPNKAQNCSSSKNIEISNQKQQESIFSSNKSSKKKQPLSFGDKIQRRVNLMQKQKDVEDQNEKGQKIEESRTVSLKQIQMKGKQTNLKGDTKLRQNLRQRRVAFKELLKSLKTNVLDKNIEKTNESLQKIKKLQLKSNLQIQILFAKTLMDNARSRHALTILQKLLYFTSQAPPNQIYHHYQISLLAGIMYYHRYSYTKSLKAFQKALSILIRLNHYSTKMLTICNNISCIYHIIKNYDQSILYIHRGFKLGQYSVDYQYLMRSNMAMSLAQKGKVKQAKAEISKVNKIVQPVNNMVIFCKFYSNLAYLQLIDPSEAKSIQKVIASFEEACNIQEKYLIPNGYRYSIFLHNNMAMLHYKRRQFKKAKMHCEKILGQLNEVEGLVGVRIHFNIGKIFSQGYNYDIPLKHFQEAKVLLSKIDERKQEKARRYKEIVNKQIEQLQRMRIDEVSEEESYKFSYMSSSLLKKV